MHILCTICSDLVNEAENIYATNCGHIFHNSCLLQWIERSKSCPQCRSKVTDRCIYRIYPTVSNENTEDVATLQSRLDDALLQLRQQKAACKETEDKMVVLHAELKKSKELLKTFEKKLVRSDFAVSALKEQLDYMKVQNKKTQHLKEENESLKKNMQTLNWALCESESKKNELRERLHSTNQAYVSEKAIVQKLLETIKRLENKLAMCMCNKLDNSKRKAYLYKHLQEQDFDLFRFSPTPPKQRKTASTSDDVICISDSDTSFPSESLLNSARNAVTKKNNEKQKNSHSIFQTKQQPGLSQENLELNEAISYDGLGGHSQLKSCIPKLTAKHKLKDNSPSVLSNIFWDE